MKGLSKGIFHILWFEFKKDTFIAISQQQGESLYDLLIETNIIEFGTSFGISTIYLAAAAKESGGFVITAELLPEKYNDANDNFEKAGLKDFIKLREGNRFGKVG
ncbi:MAG: hypothetical protein AAF502_19120 [Bacteroidota bacterium]